MDKQTKQIRDRVTYFVLCCHLRDFIDENVNESKFNFQKVKMLTNQLSKELEKSVDVVFNAEGFSDDDKNDMLHNFVSATMQMDKFFKVSLALNEIDEAKQIEFSSKIEQLVKEYGIEY